MCWHEDIMRLLRRLDWSVRNFELTFWTFCPTPTETLDTYSGTLLFHGCVGRVSTYLSAVFQAAALVGNANLPVESGWHVSVHC